jgi:hypothetical protein
MTDATIQKETALKLFNCVNEVCLTFHASVTSWWRTPARNMRVQGVPNSRHLNGTAIDVVYDGGGGAPALVTVQELARQHGCVVLRERDHDHFTFMGGGGY